MLPLVTPQGDVTMLMLNSLVQVLVVVSSQWFRAEHSLRFSGDFIASPSSHGFEAADGSFKVSSSMSLLYCHHCHGTNLFLQETPNLCKKLGSY